MTICSFVFRWVAIPWLQEEIDAYVYRHNRTFRRANRHKVLPHGIPDVMFEQPKSFGALDFKVRVFLACISELNVCTA